MNWSDYISLSSAVIALCAFAATIWQGYLARTHNMLSVTPLINVHRSTLDGISFTMESHGLGPAIIEEYALIVDDKEYVNPASDPFPEIFKNIGVSKADYLFHMPTVGEAYSNSAKLLLLQVSPKIPDLKCMEIVEQRVHFRISYSSIYRKKWFKYQGNC